MMDMYILIVCNFDDAENVLLKIENLDVIQEGHLLNGVYDMIIKISGQSFEELERINSKIRAVVGVKATLTLTGYNPSSNSN
jgi:DNA-binding Lrp family transcriptional regulator